MIIWFQCNFSKSVLHLLTEFPAVLLNVSTGLIESEFHQFVRPTNRPQLSLFCIGLTGITQQQIDRANTFPDVFRDFQKWLNEVTVQKRLVFYTKENLNRNVGQNATFCSWASFDLRHYFELEMGYNRLVRPESMAVWIDFEVEFKVYTWYFSLNFPPPTQEMNKFFLSCEYAEKMLRFLEICTRTATHGHSTWWFCAFWYRRCPRLG